MDRPGRRQLSLLALAALLVLAGCGPGPTAHRCADLFAHALATPERTVEGTFNCLSATAQASWREQHVSSDSDFRSLAAIPPVWKGVHLVGQQSDSAFLYEIQVGGRTAYLIIWQDARGLVLDDNVAYCPIGDCRRPSSPRAGQPHGETSAHGGALSVHR